MHPYTEALLAAIPVLDPAAGDPIPLLGDAPSQTEKPTGCPFHPRCPRFYGEVCRLEAPPWQESGAGDQIRCHIPPANLERMQLEKSPPRPERSDNGRQEGDAPGP
jgi:peptide/nickel transport system ATP-binding protein